MPRAPGGAHLVALLRQQAPTWVAQMPWLLTAAQRVQVHGALQGTTRERMLREGAEVLDTLTTERPLVLVLEDLHWSDAATVNLLALLARRRTPTRLLVLGTYRPGEMHGHHPVLQTVMVDLQRYGLATQLPLTELSPEAVASYLVARFPRHQFPPAFAAWLHKHTDGNLLFLVTLVQAFLTQGMLQDQAGCWTVQEDLTTLTAAMPESLRQVLDQQITRLAPACQRVVEVASVAGVAFAAPAVAVALDTAVEVVEAHCDALVTQQLLRPLGVTTWPNGTVVTRYAFRHALYQQAIYDRLGAGWRVRLHQRLGACLEAAYGARAGEVAAELAEHWVQGQDPTHAVQYLHRAAENAAQRYAYREVITLLTRALPLLSALPKTPERTQQEIDIQMTLGAAWSAEKGPAALEVDQSYARVRALCQEGNTTPQLFSALRGLVTFYNAQGALLTARALAEQLHQMAQYEAAPPFRLEAHEVLGTTLFYQGDFVAAHRHLAQGMALLDPVAQRSQVRLYGIVPGVRCLALGQYIARPLYLTLLAEAAAHTCQEEAGVPLLTEALAACEASGRGDLRAEAYRLQGAALWRRSRLDTAQATACF